jgi:hypothetical protein
VTDRRAPLVGFVRRIAEMTMLVLRDVDIALAAKAAF